MQLARTLSPLANVRRRGPVRPEALYVLLLRPLGLGDLLMLSPFVVDVASRRHGLAVFIVTEYPEFFSIPGVRWMSPSELRRDELRRGLVISPTLSWRHAPYLFGAGWYLGYFLSDCAMSNFTRATPRYDARSEHYLHRTVPLAEILNGLWPSRTLAPSYPGINGDAVDAVSPFNRSGLPDAYVCLAPYSNWKERQYPPESWRKVLAALRERLPVVLVGGSGSEEAAMAASLEAEGVINMVGKTDVGEAARLIAGSRVFVGNDSGPAHLAFLSAPASVVVFGCVGGQQRVPLDPALSARIAGLGAGRSCEFFPCYDGFNPPACRNRERYRCLVAVEPDVVVKAVFSSISTLS